MAIIAENISKNFVRGKTKNEFTALSPLSFELEEGKLTAVKGKSGSGKSTLINIISGLLRPSGGRVLYDGKDIYEMEDSELSQVRNRDFGYITQIHSPIASLNVLENILLPYTLFDSNTDYMQSDNAVYKRAVRLMERLDMTKLQEAMPSELSGGELKRMMIIRALIKEPRYIFADEPTADLDTQNTDRVFELLKELAGRGAAVLVATHENDIEKHTHIIYNM